MAKLILMMWINVNTQKVHIQSVDRKKDRRYICMVIFYSLVNHHITRALRAYRAQHSRRHSGVDDTAYICMHLGADGQ